ncbi:MAG: heavy metal translocating P-type ATPase [Schleiferiaceae bacterium]|nr:heavy metal translocating P-type ATPase [Schleiferiaceae bacterium]
MATIKKQQFAVGGMSCTVCATSVEEVLSNTEGVQTAVVNFANHKAYAEYDSEIVDVEVLYQKLKAAGYELQVHGKEEADDMQQKHFKKVKMRFIWTAIFAFPVFVMSMFFMDHQGAIALPYGNWIAMALTAPVLFWFGRSFFVNAYKQAKMGKANMDSLVALSTGIAFFFSVFNTVYPQFFINAGLQPHVYYEAAAVIIAFISLGKLLEERAKVGTSEALRKLMDLQESHVWVMENGTSVKKPIEAVFPKDEILVKTGAKIPVDGVVISGTSYVDESAITGEPVPVKKITGDKVFAGTINQKGSFTVETTAVGEETLLGKILKTVEQAQGSKAPVQKLVDRIAGVFVPVVMGIAGVTFFAWFFLGGDTALSKALITSISVLVIACPCALGLATPTAIMVGVGRAAEKQILIRDAESLERGSAVNTILVDKTGTLTKGSPEVVFSHWLQPADYYAPIAVGLEQQSSHPLAAALVQFLEKPPKTITFFEEIAGYGVKGEVDGLAYSIGNKDLAATILSELPSDVEAALFGWEKRGATPVYFFSADHLIAVFALADPIKPDTQKAIAAWKKEGFEIYMLTGDAQETALAVAQAVGIDRVHAQLKPSDKAAIVKRLQSEGRVVAMIGDGINDSEALALADVSMAMGKGADVAMDIAMITLVTSNLERVGESLKLSKNVVRIVKQNLFWAFIYNVIGIPIAAGILFPFTGFLLSPMIAAAAMALSSVSVVSNSLRLRWV